MTTETNELIEKMLADFKEQMRREQKKFGFYQLCPKCDGEGHLQGVHWDGIMATVSRTCPVCNGAKLLIRPEIINTQPQENAGR